MMLGEILVRFGAETSGLMRGIEAAKGGLASMSVFALAAGIAIAATLGVVAVKAAADFQQGLSRLKTGAGDTTDNLQKMGQAILGVSTATGVMTGPLLQAMYQIISANQRGAEAENTLKVAAQGSVAEQANVVDVARAVSGAMTDYGTKQYNATQFMNGLTRATQLGKLTLEQLATSMGPLMPVAANLGIKYSDLAGAMSTMTNASIPAERAATSLRFLMQSLENPTKKANDAMKAMGLDSVKVGNELKVSLPGALEMIYNAAKKAGPEGSVPFNRAVSDMIGGQRSLQAFLALTGGHFKTFVTDTQQVAGAMNASKTAVLGWDTAQKNFNVQMDMGKAALAALAITVGTALLPVLTNLLSKITPLITGFTSWVTSGHAVSDMITTFQQHIQVLGPILAGIAAMLLAVLIPAVWALAAGVIAATWPILAIGAAVAGIAALFIYLYKTFEPVRTAVNAVGQAFLAAGAWIAANFLPAMRAIGDFFMARILPILIQIGSFLAANFMPVWQQLVAVWNGSLLPSLRQLWSALQPLLPVLQLIGAVILAVVVVALFVLVGALAGVIKGIAGFLSGLIVVVQGIVQTFTGVAQIIGGIVGFIVDLITGHFDKLGADLGMIWQGILNVIIGVWTAIAGVFETAWFTISGIVTGFVQGIIGFFQSLATALVGGSIVPDMINNIINWFAQLPGRVIAFVMSLVTQAITFFTMLSAAVIVIVTTLINQVVQWFAQLPGRAIAAVQSLTGMLVSFFSGLASQALSWGANIINNLAAGIRNAIGAVAGAIGDVTSFIASHLPHSPAKLGPLRDLDKSGEEIVKQLSAGMGKAKPTLTASLTQVIGPPGTTTSGASGGSNEMITLLRSIDKKLDQGRPISRYELTQALGLLLAEGVRR